LDLPLDTLVDERRTADPQQYTEKKEQDTRIIMVHYAANMMVDGAPITNMILNRISILDDMGAWDWNLRLGGFVWFLVFMAIRNIFGKSNGVEWYALAHCLITGIGGVTCAYLTFIMAEEMTGTPGTFLVV